jgi:hypothetical protein
MSAWTSYQLGQMGAPDAGWGQVGWQDAQNQKQRAQYAAQNAANAAAARAAKAGRSSSTGLNFSFSPTTNAPTASIFSASGSYSGGGLSDNGGIFDLIVGLSDWAFEGFDDWIERNITGKVYSAISSLIGLMIAVAVLTIGAHFVAVGIGFAAGFAIPLMVYLALRLMVAAVTLAFWGSLLIGVGYMAILIIGSFIS